MKVVFDRAVIRGILGVIPSQVSRFDDELENYSHSRANAMKLKMLMGYDEHRIAPPHVCTSDLVRFGVRTLAQTGRVDLDQIDALVLVTQTPDYFLPATSAVLHGELGLREDVYCVDINQGCNGYIQGLFEAMMLIQTGAARKVLLAVGDTLSHRVSPQDRNSYPLIGDAAAITLLERSEEPHRVHLSIRNRGSASHTLMIPAGHSRHPSSEETRRPVQDQDGNIRTQEQLVMQGGDVFNFTQSTVPPFIEEVLTWAECPKEKIDYFLLHQANAFILNKIAQRLEVPQEKVPSNIVAKYGNSSSATIPIALADNLGSRDFEKLSLCLCGFGVGLSWGAAVMEMNKLRFCEILEYGD